MQVLLSAEATKKPSHCPSLACRLQDLPTSDNVVLSPASCWHQGINPDTAFLPCPDSYRFLFYLEGNPQSTSLMNIVNCMGWLLTAGIQRVAPIWAIDALVSAGDNSRLFRYQYAIMVDLLGNRPELRGMSPVDQFFINFYMKQYAQPGKLRVLELRKGTMAGTISVDAVGAVVPRHDLLRRRIKEKYLRQGMQGGMAREEPL